MARSPIAVAETHFDQHIRPHLSVAKRGYVSEIPVSKIFNSIIDKLRTGCQWEVRPMDTTADGLREASDHVPY